MAMFDWSEKPIHSPIDQLIIGFGHDSNAFRKLVFGCDVPLPGQTHLQGTTISGHDQHLDFCRVGSGLRLPTISASSGRLSAACRRSLAGASPSEEKEHVGSVGLSPPTPRPWKIWRPLVLARCPYVQFMYLQALATCSSDISSCCVMDVPRSSSECVSDWMLLAKIPQRSQRRSPTKVSGCSCGTQCLKPCWNACPELHSLVRCRSTTRSRRLPPSHAK